MKGQLMNGLRIQMALIMHGNSRCPGGLLPEQAMRHTRTPCLGGVQNGADAPKSALAAKVETVLVSTVVPVPESPFLHH
jgi:hypothetical protein